jgi:UDP-N-acetylmuramoyl-tripeptide--D-alanyl-D-alanine ligase
VVAIDRTRLGPKPLRYNARCRLSCPILGEHHIYVLLPSLLAGLVTGIDLERGCQVLADFSLPPGRMTRIDGVNSSTILDSTWNASPRSVEAALETLRSLPARRRIAVLGSILGLGERTESGQREVGRIVSRLADVLITVGAEARLMAEEATARGMPEEVVLSFDTAEEAGRYLKECVRPGDVVLLKASQSLRLNHAIRCFMKDPDRADRLLDAR